MHKNLVIVESPAKAKTIEKFLGEEYKVLSSYGHIRDLKKKGFGIDIEHNYTPQYEIPSDKKKVVDALKSEAKKADMVWLASDEDREGEAIAWHLYEVLGLTPEKTKRIVFHEITKEAILKAIKEPRDIDQNLVNAQQARRVLDRIVGFELSPILWRKIKPSLSAGRVQSVAVRLIVDRETEIQNFVSEASFRIIGNFKLEEQVTLKAELSKRLKNEKEAQSLLEKCTGASFAITDITVKPAKRTPAPPFTTSTLQQEAARKLGFTVAQTMMVAQKLYESGHITYMRTDSVNLSSLAINTAKQEIVNRYGEKYLKIRKYNTKTKGAQEAHEAIRPTYLSQEKIDGSAQEKRLYDLIWKRTIASQMSEAELERTTVAITTNKIKEEFISTGEVIKFDGFLSVYIESTDDDDDKESTPLLPPMQIGQSVTAEDITATERFSQRPARYTEASLVRKLEELGIGRPSTYAPTISTVQQRQYVEKGDRPGEERQYIRLTWEQGKIQKQTCTETVGSDKGKLLPTDIGTVVNEYLTDQFPQILDYNFTAQVEQKFDEIAEGEQEWSQTIENFYTGFHPTVEQALSNRAERKVGERELGTDPQTGEPVLVKIGRFGPLVQIGGSEEDKKPRFASLKKDQTISTITLEEALELFKLPRTLGEYEGKTITVGNGRFGPYIYHNSKYISIPKTEDPLSISLETAIELIENKRKEELERIILRFDQDADLEVLNGRYGPYICYKKENFKLPKGTIATELTYEECMNIVSKAQSEGNSKGKSKGTRQKKSTK